LTGLLAGVLVGVIDATISGSPFLDVSFLLAAVLGWSAVMLPAATLLGGLTASALRRQKKRGWRSAPALASGLSVTVLLSPLWFIVLVQLNVVWLGAATAFSSLAADLAVTILAITAAWVLGRWLADALRRSLRLCRLLIEPVVMVLVAVTVLVAAVLAWPYGSGGTLPPAAVAATERPNVVLILIDTLRRDHLSGEGYHRRTSPFLDSVADHGVRFTGCLSQSSYTKPSVASLITSTYLSGHGAGNPTSVLSERHPTVVEAFHQAGYRTAMVVANPTISQEQGFAQGAELFHCLESLLLPRTRLGYGLSKLSQEGHTLPFAGSLLDLLFGLEQSLFRARGAEVLSLLAPEVAEAFLGWQSTIGDDPYFAYLHFMEPHAPYVPPAEVATRFAGAGEPMLAQHPSITGVFLPFVTASPLPEPARAGLIRAYDAEIAYTDQVLADLIGEIRERSGASGTIIAITSDHGEEMYEHQAWGHGHSLHGELLEVPLIFVGPGIPQGLVVPRTIELIDLAPTLLEMAGVPIPAGMSGRSLLRLQTKEGQAEPQEAFSELAYGKTYWARALQQGHYKLIVSRLGERRHVALFNLAADPEELHNLVEDRPELAAMMLARIDELVAAAAAGKPAEQVIQLDATTEERLRALGYL
jgi:arylsulfatase A-like enzyme/uncharacterized membrane protein (DUF485 family)